MSFNVWGTIQYATSAEGSAALAWMDGWALSHQSMIYDHPGLTNGHTLSVIDPPNPAGGCVAQLVYEYHFTFPQIEVEFVQAEIERALQVDIATAACDSQAGAGADP